MMSDAGAQLIEVPAGEPGIDLPPALPALGRAGHHPGAGRGRRPARRRAAARTDLVDRIAWFHAPAVMGGDGWPAAQAFGVEHLAIMPRFVHHGSLAVGR